MMVEGGYWRKMWLNAMDLDPKQYANIPFNVRTDCAICGSKLDNAIIELPNFPLTEIYTKYKIEEKIGFVDQKFHVCSKCGHGQISHIIDQKLLYGKDYFYRSSTSPTAPKAIDDFISFMKPHIGRREKIVDIGCNDLYTLNRLSCMAKYLIGIDPILKGKEQEFNTEKVTVYGDFAENVIENLSFDKDLIISSHTLEHVPEPKLSIKYLLDNATLDTLFAFQFPCLEALIEDYRFDQIYHQHLNYFSIKSILYMLNELGAELIDYKINYGHWGATMILFRKSKGTNIKIPTAKLENKEISKRYATFKGGMKRTNECLRSYRDKELYGYGAALMLPVLSYHLNNDLSSLKCIIDDDERKNGLYYINLPTVIRYSENIEDLKEATVLVTAISAKDNVRKIVSKLISKDVRNIIIPLMEI